MSGVKRTSPGAEEQKNPLALTLSDDDGLKLENAQKAIARVELKIQRIAEVQLVAAYEARRAITKTIPKFWAIALMNHTIFGISCQHNADQQAISYLEDVRVDRDPKEPRCFTLEFHFKENPYFTDSVLKKEYKYTPPTASADDKPDEDGITDAMLDFSWGRDVVASKMPISWKDPAKALTKLYPAQGGGDNDDDDDDATDTGSFFNFFETTDDPLELGNSIANEVYPEAIDFFLGNTGDDGEIDSDEEDDDDDDAEEIDLEKPKPKKQKV
ncbi:hypothetical protein BDV98DRAFT_559516 [Pterulicium gracile]|uniref:Nucleosome assembly protein n=1 Tax=Pterulicium gracile TaxID=1884261 RepID=A0A5C3QYS6_9AGAR|nr:hypothetical protein BDV98DRAFT_559516 [Pterula gracilis]